MAQNTIIGDEAFDTTLMGERTFGWGTSFPSTWHANGFFLRTDTNVFYQNTGTEGSPTWTQVFQQVDLGLILALGD